MKSKRRKQSRFRPNSNPNINMNKLPQPSKKTSLWQKIKATQLYADVWTLIHECQEDTLNIYAGLSAYFLVISVIPMLVLVCSVFGMITQGSYQDVLVFLQDTFPEPMQGFVEIFLGEAYERANPAWFSLSTLLILWASSRSIYTLRLGLNKAMHIPRRSYLYSRLSALIYTLVVGFLMSVIVVFLIFGNQIQGILQQIYPEFGSFARYFIGFRTLSSLAIQFVFVWLLYSGLPDTYRTPVKILADARAQGETPGMVIKKRLKRTLPGTIFTCVCWWVFSLFFIINQLFFSPNATLYGRLGAALLSLVWLYMCLLLFLIGGAFNRWFWEKDVIGQVKALWKKRRTYTQIH